MDIKVTFEQTGTGQGQTIARVCVFNSITAHGYVFSFLTRDPVLVSNLSSELAGYVAGVGECLMKIAGFDPENSHPDDTFNDDAELLRLISYAVFGQSLEPLAWE